MERYRGNVYASLFDVIQKNDGFSVGEKLTQIEKITKKRFFNLSDKEIYEALEKYKNTPIEEDEKLSDEEFVGWVTMKGLDGTETKIFAANAVLTKRQTMKEYIKQYDEKIKKSKAIEDITKGLNEFLEDDEYLVYFKGKEKSVIFSRRELDYIKSGTNLRTDTNYEKLLNILEANNQINFAQKKK